MIFTQLRRSVIWCVVTRLPTFVMTLTALVLLTLKTVKTSSNVYVKILSVLLKVIRPLRSFHALNMDPQVAVSICTSSYGQTIKSLTVNSSLVCVRLGRSRIVLHEKNSAKLPLMPQIMSLRTLIAVVMFLRLFKKPFHCAHLTLTFSDLIRSIFRSALYLTLTKGDISSIYSNILQNRDSSLNVFAFTPHTLSIDTSLNLKDITELMALRYVLSIKNLNGIYEHARQRAELQKPIPYTSQASSTDTGVQYR